MPLLKKEGLAIVYSAACCGNRDFLLFHSPSHAGCVIMSKALKSAAHRLQVEIRICRLVLKDSRAPRPAKLLLWLALAHALSPIDLVPDFIPLLGQLDDLIIVPAFLIAALKLIPKEVIEDCRAKAVMADQTARSESSSDNFREENRVEREENREG